MAGEKVSDEYHFVIQGDVLRTFRMPVPGGWLYQTVYVAQLQKKIAISCAFVPDPEAK